MTITPGDTVELNDPNQMRSHTAQGAVIATWEQWAWVMWHRESHPFTELQLHLNKVQS